MEDIIILDHEFLSILFPLLTTLVTEEKAIQISFRTKYNLYCISKTFIVITSE